MEITARLTKDAEVRAVKGDRNVVGFTVAMNKRYKTSKGEIVENTQYVECSYWLSTKVAQYLTKGTLVGLYGDIGVNAYVNSEGQPRASLTFHVNNLKIHSRPQNSTKATTSSSRQSTNETDDLPF